MKPKPDFVEFVDFTVEDAVWNACARMYQRGTVFLESRPRPGKGRDIVEIRGWKVSPYA